MNKQNGLSKDQFNDLFLDTSELIFNLGLRLFFNEEDAMDFTQDVYEHARRKYHLFEGRSRFSTWLYSVAMNYGLNRIKKNKKRILILKENIDESVDKYTEIKDHSEVIAEKEILNTLQNEIKRLPDAYRLPLMLHYYDQMPYEEMEQKLGIPAGTLKSNVYRAKQKLREPLIQRGIKL